MEAHTTHDILKGMVGTPKPNRRWLQYSLRSLLVLMLSAGLGMSWVLATCVGVIALDVEVRGNRLLELSVEDGGDGNNGDWGVWISPQLQSSTDVHR